MSIEYNVLLDATLDDCPVPTIRTKETLDSMREGEVLKVVTSKEGTVGNLRTLIKNNPYELLSQSRDSDSFEFYIRKL